MEKPKILWLSDLVTPTGFSRVSHGILKYIVDDFDITGIGVNYFGDPHNYNMKIFPASNQGGNIYGDKRLVDLLNSEKFDALFILNDVWVIDRYLAFIKKHVEESRIPKIVVYFPVDAEMHDADWYRHFDIVSKAVVYTEFGKQVVKAAAPSVETKIIPHGVDSDVFYHKFVSRKDAKLHLLANQLDSIGDLDKSFIVFNGNRNQPRKKLDLTMEGFAKFAKNKPKEVKLYMHCGIVDASMNIVKLAVRYGIDDRLIISSDKPGVQTIHESRLNDIYNACDVGINTSLGEGWGLVNVEHAVTGAAQIVPDHSACRELFTDCGYLIPANIPSTFDNSMTVGKLVTSDDVANVLEECYANAELRDAMALAGKEKFLREEYQWKNIANTWKELFIGVMNDTNTSPVSEQH